MREWIRTRLTLRRITIRVDSPETTSPPSSPKSGGSGSGFVVDSRSVIGKSRRNRPPPCHAKWKLSVDRTIVKEVRRLPPHGTLMILHAVRVPGILKDHDDSYGVKKQMNGKPKGYSARNGRNAGIMIVGHNPVTGERMSMIPDQNVLSYATKSDRYKSLKYLSQGGDRHMHMRSCAEKVISQLVLMNRNGTPTLSHEKMRWVQEAMERAAAAAALEAAFRLQATRDRALRIALQALCQRVRLRRYRMSVMSRRRGLHLRELPEPTHEWGAALHEDLQSHINRRFLTADKKEFIAIKGAFDVFDADGSGSIDAKEFQSLCFEIGEVLSQKQVKKAIQAIDRDGSGQIEFDEFAMWWVTTDHTDASVGGLSASKIRRLKGVLQRRRWRRQAKEKLYMKIRNARLAGKQYAQRRRDAKEAKKKKILEAKIRRERLAAMRRGEFGFAAAANARSGPSKYEAQAGGGDKLMKREKPWDGIPGGQVGIVLLSPYWATRWEIKKRLRARALKKKRMEEAIEMERARKKALEEAAAEKLRKMLEEEERLAKEAETERERELEEARKLAEKQAEQARAKLLEEQRAREEEEERIRKEAEAAAKKAAALKLLEEKKRKLEEERLARLEIENKAEFDRIQEEKAEEERLIREEKEREEKMKMEAKKAEIAKQMELKLAQQKKDAASKSRDAKKAKQKKEDQEREKRQARMRRRAGGGGGAGAKKKGGARAGGGRKSKRK
jgi:hypothetical protein